jgi:hypothetical protein
MKESLMIRIFSIIFFMTWCLFIIGGVKELYVYFTQGVAWIHPAYFLLIVPMPIIGYIMMLAGEYLDNRKNNF